jgi:hypothetical protein
MKKQLSIIVLVLLLLFAPSSASASEKIKVAVAANFIQAFNDIASSFENKEGVKIEPTFSSSGNLYAQIINGAPYDGGGYHSSMQREMSFYGQQIRSSAQPVTGRLPSKQK